MNRSGREPAPLLLFSCAPRQAAQSLMTASFIVLILLKLISNSLGSMVTHRRVVDSHSSQFQRYFLRETDC